MTYSDKIKLAIVIAWGLVLVVCVGIIWMLAP